MRVARAVRLDYSLNCVYDQKGQIVRIVAAVSRVPLVKQSIYVYRNSATNSMKKSMSRLLDLPHTHGHQFCKGLSALML